MNNSDDTAAQVGHATAHVPAPGCLPLDGIRDPGAYLCHWNGHLLRVTPQTMCQDHASMVDVVDAKAMMVTKVSDNPFVTMRQAREVAANMDLPVNF